MSETGARFEAQPNVGNHFAWIRTQLGLQRTLMAAVRTGVSLIGFGFTVAQFFQRLMGSAEESARHLGPDAPRNLGLVLIGAGVVCVAAFTWDYRQTSAYMLKEYSAIAVTRKMRTSSYVVAFVVMLIGVAAFGSVFLRF